MKTLVLLGALMILPATVLAKPTKAKPKKFCDATAITQVIAAKSQVFRACYEKQAAKQPTLSGRLAVQWFVQADGTVKTAESKVLFSSMKTAKVETCIVNMVNKFTFAEPKNGACTIRFPFVFNTAR